MGVPRCAGYGHAATIAIFSGAAAPLFPFRLDKLVESPPTSAWAKKGRSQADGVKLCIWLNLEPQKHAAQQLEYTASANAVQGPGSQCQSLRATRRLAEGRIPTSL